MLADKDKMSLRQALFLFLSLSFSIAIRIIPVYTAQKAKQVGYLAPIISFVIFMLFILLLNKIYIKYGDGSISDIIYKIIGFFIGKTIISLYILWVTIYLALFVRYYGERIVSSLFPFSTISIFIIIMLAFVALVLHSGIVAVGRMNEVILIIVNFVFLVLMVFLLPQVELKRLTPISYIDFLPILNASWGVTSIWGSILLIFFIGDEINNKERLVGESMKVAVYIMATTILLIAIIVGSMGYSVVEQVPIPFMVAVKLISIFEILEKIESIVVIIWVLTDFIGISVLTYIALKMIKSLFGLSDAKSLINIYLVLIYFASMFMCSTRFELEDFSTKIAIPIHVFMFFILPTVIFGIGLIKRKKTPQ